MEKSYPACTPEGESKEESVAVEEPLQITLDGLPIAVVMRTPGHDEDLVRGFLLTESVLPSLDHLRRLNLEPNNAHAFLHDAPSFDPAALRRNLYSASSCGICGKASIDSILLHHPPIENPIPIPHRSLLAAPGLLCAAQTTFHATGGLHAAALFSPAGELLALREDIGRHNALDKLIGHAAHTGIPTARTFLLLSGRVSFELIQKALAARISLVAAISAPSSLAIDFAKSSRQTLVAFLRPPAYNIYTGA